MDLSALIFVALAAAWAVYLVPKALKHHEEDAVSRSVDGFSDRMRVLARREAVSASQATLVRAGATAPASPATSTPTPRADRSASHSAALSATERRLRRQRQAAARRAAERRRRVFNLLLLAIVVVGALAVGKVLAAVWVALPGALMALWLVACRVMVRRERAAVAERIRRRRRTLADEAMAAEDSAERAAAEGPERVDEFDDNLDDNTDEIPVVQARLAGDEPADQPADGWTPVPVPLPTYVAKEQAGRTVRTIDLDSTGVWSSGRNDADSQLAREADAQRARSDAEGDAEQHRATGS